MANTGSLPRKAAMLRAVFPLYTSVIMAFMAFIFDDAFTVDFAKKAVGSQLSSRGMRISFSSSLSFSAC